LSCAELPGVSVVANDHISLIIGVVKSTAFWENGAGKSTLINILSGMLQPDEGQIFWRGQELNSGFTPRGARLGIGTVYRHFTLVPNLSVIENVILGADKGSFVLNCGAWTSGSGPLRRLGLAVSPQLDTTSVPGQQQSEIIKALFRGSEYSCLTNRLRADAPRGWRTIRDVTPAQG
jgi:simple sugar transport system ATP-binding protein